MSKQNNTKYIFVTGGVLSGLGKGITAASIGNLLKARGYSVNIQKLDPYLNVDAGTLNPAEHGECFVTKDGAETDLDLGHYERFLDVELTQTSSVMSGRILRSLIEDERAGKYLGKTVQVLPHFTDAIQGYIEESSKGFDIHIVEIGGTVGDYESPPFFEAIREYAQKAGKGNYLNVQVVYMPYLSTSKEIKTKPAQNAVRELRSMGIMPNLLVARSEVPTNGPTKAKLSAFCGVEEAGIAVLPNARSVYEVPLTLEEQGIGEYIVEQLGLKKKKANHKQWSSMVDRILETPKNSVKVGVVAKYLDNEDTYICVMEALKSACWENNVQFDFDWIDAEKVEKAKDLKKLFKGYDGIVVPGGFGSRGVEGKILAAQFAYENNVPYLGLCLGLQVAVIATARNAGHVDANSSEFNPSTSCAVIDTMIDQRGLEGTGGTMRLGDYPCNIEKGSLADKVYKSKKIVERHRHRYECNNNYREDYEKWGIKATGVSPDGTLVEIIEAPKKKFFLASQFHPEFKSRPNRPHPMFSGFVKSMIK
ncbi:MAG: CTP synthase [bacterium]|nr:CTP synthase [bacterium]